MPYRACAFCGSGSLGIDPAGLALTERERLAKVDACYSAVQRWQMEELADLRFAVPRKTAGMTEDEAIALVGNVLDKMNDSIDGLQYVVKFYLSTLHFLAKHADRGPDAIDFAIKRCGDNMVPHLTRCPNPLRCNLQLDKGEN